MSEANLDPVNPTKSELEAALEAAAETCDQFVKELDDRTPNYHDPKSGDLVHEEHPTEAQIAAIVSNHVSDSVLKEWEPKLEAEVRSRMKAEPWEYAGPKK